MNKQVLLGVCGSIAAYKAADIARGLMREGLNVRVVMTTHATQMIAPATFAALTGNPVLIDAFDEPVAGQIAHIQWAQEADLILIAPATAHTLAKLALGLADDMLTTLALAATAPLYIAPAMNPAMWSHPATQHNIQILTERGAQFIPPAFGIMACGDEGWGKLAEVEAIVQHVAGTVLRPKDLQGMRVLITAGPTYEPIDPVRFVGNRSSGKMGYAIAQAARERGAEVTLISGPVSLPAPAGVEVIFTQTADQMLTAVQTHFEACDVFVAAAAVADYKPAQPLSSKRKRDSKLWALEMVPNPDIVATVAAHKGNRYIVGFAAETDKVVENALHKLKKKGLDLIAANDVSAPGRGFEVDTNQLTLFFANGIARELPLMSKRETAHALWDAILEGRHAK